MGQIVIVCLFSCELTFKIEYAADTKKVALPTLILVIHEPVRLRVICRGPIDRGLSP